MDYIYGDPEHPERVTRTISGPPYAAEDHALLAGLRTYERTLCPGGCGEPIERAWHSDMDGWYDEVHKVVCHACSARDGREHAFTFVGSSRDFTAQPLPPFHLHDGTTSPAGRPAPVERPFDVTLKGGDA